MNKVASFIQLAVIHLTLSSCGQNSIEVQLTEWIAKNANHINTVEAGNGFEDLIPFGGIVGDARIVSLGEPTHGNREVFQLKHRLVEYLITEKGFNILALECPFGEAFDVNRYVLDGIGTPEKALAGIYYWTWDTQEVLELLKWLRAYNADPAHTKKVKFYGFDTQDPERAARFMLEYLEKVDPELWQEVLPELHTLQVPFSIPEAMGRRQYIPSEYDAASLKAIKEVVKAFNDNKEPYALVSSAGEWTIAKRHARLVEMYIEAYTNDGESDRVVRERGQAENIQWILDHEGQEAKAIVWAHNSHVANDAPQGFELMGAHLKRHMGDELKIFGLFFNQGSFNALDVDTPSKGIFKFTVGSAPKGTLEYFMASAGLALALVDMHQLPNQGPVYNWFHTQQRTRHSGAGYNLNKPENYLWSYKLAEAYDGLIFLDTTSPAVYNDEADFEALWLLDKKNNQAVNLDFENNNPGEAPEGWLVWSRFQRLGAELMVTNENPYQGKQCAVLHRSKGLYYGEIAPNLTQRIEASPFRGKTIRLKAAARSEVAEPGFAFLRLAIEPNILKSAHDGEEPIFDSLDTVRITSSSWNIYEITADVPETAYSITFGLYLRDFGSVWLDDLEIEIID